MIEWYFAEENKPKNVFVDKFSDSKFGLNKWNSFAREIIQNSLDVFDTSLGTDIPVEVRFEAKDFTIEQIPGAIRLKQIIELCLLEPNLNPQTRTMYSNALSILGTDKITCLKISDFNTIGVETGIDKSWGALVYDEGVSKKVRPGSSGGSHGVGKKVPFIISGINTVFYSTKNSTDELFEGKTSLVNWKENDITYDFEGWLGVRDDANPDRRERVKPVNISGVELDIDDFFVRRDKKGTDVIIIGVDFTNDYEGAKRTIINAIMENFFVAIDSNKLVCDVFGQKIDKNNFSDVLRKYYVTTGKNFKRMDGYKNIKNGNLNNYYRVYCGTPYKFDLVHEEIVYGYAEVYFDLKNDKMKKYYCIAREMGMKIKDVELNVDQAYSAVVVVKNYQNSILPEEKRINGVLLSRENAAHDDFIIDDEQNKCDELSKALIEQLYEKIESYIKEKTEIEITDETPLEGLSDMLSLQGILTKSATRRTTPKTTKKKHKVKKKSMGDRAKNYDDGTSGAGGLEEKKKKKGVGENKPATEGNSFKATIFEKFSLEPVFFHLESGYRIKFISDKDIKSADIIIQPISVDGTIASIDNILLSAKKDNKKLKIDGNKIKNVKFLKGEVVNIEVQLKNNLDYVLDCEVMVGGKDAKEL